jgi:hypothetical protein
MSIQNQTKTNVEPDEPPYVPRLRDLFFLRVLDKGTIALFVFVVLLAGGVWYVWHKSQPAGLIDIDTAPRQQLHLLVDINTASAEELMLLPEVAEKLSEIIFKDSEKRGYFKSPADFLRRIDGIGKKNFEKMQPYITGWTNDNHSSDK